MINFKTNPKKYIWAIIFLTIASLILIWQIFTRASNRKGNPIGTPIPTGWQTVVPGESTKEDLINKFGSPTTEDGANNNLYFKSNSPTRDTQVKLSNNGDIVDLVVVANTLDEKTVDEISAEYGYDPVKLYGSLSGDGYFLFVYPQKGVAYLGNPLAKNILEIWYFAPLTSVEEFIQKWAPRYSTEKQTKPTE